VVDAVGVLHPDASLSCAQAWQEKARSVAAQPMHAPSVGSHGGGASWSIVLKVRFSAALRMMDAVAQLQYACRAPLSMHNVSPLHLMPHNPLPLQVRLCLVSTRWTGSYWSWGCPLGRPPHEGSKGIITHVNMIVSAFQSEQHISEADAVLAHETPRPRWTTNWQTTYGIV